MSVTQPNEHNLLRSLAVSPVRAGSVDAHWIVSVLPVSFYTVEDGLIKLTRSGIARMLELEKGKR